MAHTFLLEAGRWILQGHWLDREGPPMPVKGKILVAWSRDNWYSLVIKLAFPDSERPDLTFQYRGYFATDDRRYSFVLQHSELGRVEGEGWIAPGSIVQRYWVLGDKNKRRTGFETLHRLSDDCYYMSSSVMSGHYLSSTMEASVQRQNQK